VLGTGDGELEILLKFGIGRFGVEVYIDEPRPPESFPYGSPNLRRLRAGRYCVFYTIDEEGRVIQIDHVARLP
jgi:mRNA interferase RelE/StbE